MQDPASFDPGGQIYYIEADDGTNCYMYYYVSISGPIVCWTNDAERPWNGTWSVADIYAATNTLVVAVTDGEEELAGTYYHEETIAGLKNWVKDSGETVQYELFLSGNGAAYWVLLARDNTDPENPVVTSYYKNTNTVLGWPWYGDWEQDDGTGTVAVAKGVTNLPTIVRDAGALQAAQTPWVQNIDAATHSLTNAGTVQASLFVFGSGSRLYDDGTNFFYANSAYTNALTSNTPE
jgi:hypothetical protein